MPPKAQKKGSQVKNAKKATPAKKSPAKSAPAKSPAKASKAPTAVQAQGAGSSLDAALAKPGPPGIPEWPVFEGTNWLVNTLQDMINKMTTPHQQVMNLVLSYRVSALVRTLTEGQLIDQIGSGKTAAQVAKALGLKTGFVDRILHAATLHNIMNVADGKYTLTPVGELLTRAHPRSMSEFTRMSTHTLHMDGQFNLHKSLKTGNSGFKEVYGEEFFDYINKNDKHFSELFNQAMLQQGPPMIASIMADYKFPESGEICDMGGGTGTFMAAVVKQYPGMKANVLDLSDVCKQGRVTMKKLGLAGRVTHHEGSFLDPLPKVLSSVDIFIFKFSLHVWSDEDAIKILKNIQKIMKPSAKVVVVDCILGTSNPVLERPKMMLDLLMMSHAQSGARDRSIPEYSEMFAKAGMRFAGYFPTRSFLGVIEATL